MVVTAIAPTRDLDMAVDELREGLPSWQELPIGERIALLRKIRRQVGEESGELLAALRRVHGVGISGIGATEPVSTLLAMVQPLRSFEQVLSRVAEGQEPLPPRSVHRRSDGRVVVDVFPWTWEHRVLFGDYRAEVWMAPDQSEEQVRARAAAAYRGSGFERPGVALLLAAGNAANLLVSDVLHLMFGEGCVVAVKMHPVLGDLRPLMERVLEPLVSGGWLRFVDDSAASGAYLVSHEGIDRIHMTGSAATYDAIVWGADEAGRSGSPVVDKQFTAELGGVSPVIVVPGPWTREDIRRQADFIAFAKLFNMGHICVSPQVLVLPDGWPGAEPLLEEIRTLLRAQPHRAPHYPGSEARVARARADQQNVEALLEPGHRVLVHCLEPTEEASILREEVFADVLGVVRLPAPDLDEYLAGAVRFANDRLAGTLAVHLLVDPETRKADALALDRAISDLKYGTVAINEWSTISFLLGSPTWGAYPGHSREAIGSGVGTVLNSFQLEGPEKTVVSGAFRPRIKPLTSLSNRTAVTTCRRLLAYLTTDELRHLPGVFVSVLRG